MSSREELKAYLDGEVSAARKLEIEAELSRSPELQAELLQLRAISSTIRSSVKPAAVGLEQTLRALQAPHKLPWWRAQPAMAGAALGLVFAAVVSVAVISNNNSEMSSVSVPAPKEQRSTSRKLEISEEGADTDAEPMSAGVGAAVPSKPARSSVLRYNWVESDIQGARAEVEKISERLNGKVEFVGIGEHSGKLSLTVHQARFQEATELVEALRRGQPDRARAVKKEKMPRDPATRVTIDIFLGQKS